MPSVVVPSLKVTVPVGLVPVTVALSVVAWPALVGLGVAVTLVLLVVCLLVTVIGAEVVTAPRLSVVLAVML